MNERTPNILVVDDDRNICKVFSMILRKRGWNVEVANNGKEAIKKSEEAVFNVALLDIKLPDIEGTKLLKLLHETTPKMIKIIVTGYPQVNNAIEALNKGADAYVTKPVHPEDLLRTIQEKLEEQRQTEDMTEDRISAFLETRTKQLLQKIR